MKVWRLSMLFVLICTLTPVALLASPPDLNVKNVLNLLQDDDLPVPEAWSGIWQNSASIFLCGTEIPLSTTNFVDTLCVGDPSFSPEDQEIEFTCTGTVTSTTVDVVCTGSFEVTTGCTQTSTFDYLATLSGDSYSAVTVADTEFVGDCGELTDICIRLETQGTRTGPQPGDCATPVEAIHWGGLKTLYR